MKKLAITLIVFSLALPTLLKAQGDEKDPTAKAQAILDEVTKKTKSYTSIKAEFEYKLENSEGINETQKGSILLKGQEKYIVKMAGREIYCNGETIWTFVPDASEVTINDTPEPGEETEGLVNPATVFTLYDDGFKPFYEKSTKVDGKAADVIRLFPQNPKDKPYHTVILTVDQVKKEILNIVIKSKDGNQYTFSISKFEPNVAAPDSGFEFDEDQADEVIDLRF